MNALSEKQRDKEVSPGVVVCLCHVDKARSCWWTRGLSDAVKQTKAAYSGLCEPREWLELAHTGIFLERRKVEYV